MRLGRHWVIPVFDLVWWGLCGYLFVSIVATRGLTASAFVLAVVAVLALTPPLLGHWLARHDVSYLRETIAMAIGARPNADLQQSPET